MKKINSKSLVKGMLDIRISSDVFEMHQFDESWNFQVDDFIFSKIDSTTVRISFTFMAQLVDKESDTSSILIPGESMTEFLELRERLETLLDIISLQIGVPLLITEGSIELSSAGGGTLRTSNTYIRNINDLEGLNKRYKNIFGNRELRNALRFYRLSMLDKEINGKGTKLWAIIEALYKTAQKNEKTIWLKLNEDQKKSVEKIINSLLINDKEKETLIGILKATKTNSPIEILSKNLELISKEGAYSHENIMELLKWWSKSRHTPAHGEIIELTDESRIEAVKDMEDTLETLLQSKVNPELVGFFIGNPKDVDSEFWDENDFMITKFASDCWAKPVHWGSQKYLLDVIPQHKISSNGPLIFVTHNYVIDVMSPTKINITDFSNFPTIFTEAINRIQSKLNTD